MKMYVCGSKVFEDEFEEDEYNLYVQNCLARERPIKRLR